MTRQPPQISFPTKVGGLGCNNKHPTKGGDAGGDRKLIAENDETLTTFCMYSINALGVTGESDSFPLKILIYDTEVMIKIGQFWNHHRNIAVC